MKLLSRIKHSIAFGVLKALFWTAPKEVWSDLCCAHAERVERRSWKHTA